MGIFADGGDVFRRELLRAYLIFRNWYHAAFVAGSNTLDITLGTTNTAVLIGSSFTMAMAVYSAEMRRKGQLILFLLLTIGLGSVFLGIKAVEYHQKYVDHHIPGMNFSIQEFVNPSNPKAIKLAPDMAEKTQLYFFLYFAMTGMHALHMIIGIGILFFLVARASKGAFTERPRHAHRKLRIVLALCRHHLDIPVPIAVPDQSLSIVADAICKRN